LKKFVVVNWPCEVTAASKRAALNTEIFSLVFNEKYPAGSCRLQNECCGTDLSRPAPGVNVRFDAQGEF
jgi:hypothetical protein